MIEERYIRQFRSELIQAHVERCVPPKLGHLNDSPVEVLLGIATLGAYQAIKTTRLYHIYNKEKHEYFDCLKNR
jgi:hypothetical protein